MDRAQLLAVRIWREREVDETGACDVDARDELRGAKRADERVRKIARFHAKRRRCAHGDVRGKIPVALIASALQLRVEVRKTLPAVLRFELAQGVAENLF
jgi:hypothetical protein